MIHCINCIWAFGCFDLDTDDYLNQQVEECKNYIDYRELIKQKNNNKQIKWKNMEYEVGEIVEIGEKKYKVIEDVECSCKNCSFNHTTCWHFNLGCCMSQYREDKKNVNFKLVEK